MSYTLDGKELIFDESNILSVIVDYDYDLKNMPIMLLKLSVDKKIIDNMIENVNKKWVVVTINKFIENAKPKVERTVIKDRFVYFLPSTELNKTDELDYSDGNKNITKTVTLGLMHLDSLNYNKRVINTVYKNATVFDMVYDTLNTNRLLLIEPFNNNPRIKELLVNPCSTVNEFIKFINSQNPPYKTAYRLFHDYDKTYFMSSSGSGLPSKDELYNSVIINVTDVISANAKMQGMIINQTAKSYILDVGLRDIDFVEDKFTEVKSNKVMTVNSTGGTNSSEINKFKKDDTLFSGSNRVSIRRVNSNNLNSSEVITNDMQNNYTRMNLIRNDIDGSIFTINKEYNVKNTGKTNNKDGRYILVSKKEAYVRKEGSFMITVILMFKKIES